MSNREVLRKNVEKLEAELDLVLCRAAHRDNRTAVYGIVKLLDGEIVGLFAENPGVYGNIPYTATRISVETKVNPKGIINRIKSNIRNTGRKSHRIETTDIAQIPRLREEVKRTISESVRLYNETYGFLN